MTFSYDCSTNLLTITDNIFTLGNTLTVTINNTVQSGTLDTVAGTYIVTATKDVLQNVIAKDNNGTTITQEVGCYLPACESEEDSLLCKVIKYSVENSDKDIIYDYLLLKEANNCPCKCSDLQTIESSINDKIKDCQC